LAFLLSLAEIKLLETTLASFRHAEVRTQETAVAVPAAAVVMADGR